MGEAQKFVDTRAIEIATQAHVRIESHEKHNSERWSEARAEMRLTRKETNASITKLRDDTFAGINQLQKDTSYEFRAQQRNWRWTIGIFLTGISITVGGLYKILDLVQ